jgi:hypothetical protein
MLCASIVSEEREIAEPLEQEIGIAVAVQVAAVKGLACGIEALRDLEPSRRASAQEHEPLVIATQDLVASVSVGIEREQQLPSHCARVEADFTERSAIVHFDNPVSASRELLWDGGIHRRLRRTGIEVTGIEGLGAFGTGEAGDRRGCPSTHRSNLTRTIVPTRETSKSAGSCNRR